MQNENNLFWLTPNKSKGKKKKKKPQPVQEKAFTPRARDRSSLLVVPQQQQTFQAPHQQPEAMEDLTDDTSPSVPISSGSWKPVGSTESPGEKNDKQSGLQLTPTRQEKWLKFQESIQSKLDKKNQEKLKNQANEQKNQESQKDSSDKDIKDSFQHNSSQRHDSKGETPSNNKASSLEQGRNTSPRRSHHRESRHYGFNLGPATGKGIPRTFLMHQQSIGIYGAIQPQDQESNPSSNSNTTPKQSAREAYVCPTSAPGPAPLHVIITNTVEPKPMEKPQQYSPSDIFYNDSVMLEQGINFSDQEDGSECSDSTSQAGQKRLSAFQRLGPLTQPKKPKLKINLLCNKDESVREVVDETETEDKDKNIYVPVYKREEIINSSDEIVKKYLSQWPWKRDIPVKKSVTLRNSKSVMMLEQEQMEETYEKDHTFIQINIKGYPASWKKEDVLNVVLENLKGKSFIPCFIEFTQEECKFLVMRCRSALALIHKIGFAFKKGDVDLTVTISKIELGRTNLEFEFIPRLVLRKMLSNNYDGERKLSLKEFTLKYDISNFIFFPLYRVSNQNELVKLQTTIAWDYITDLDLSHNKIISIEGFEFEKSMPRLQNLDLSFNHLERVTALLKCRGLSLHSLKLEGNPLCLDYIDPAYYVKVVRMIFPTLRELDGVKIQLSGEFPKFKKNYCPEDAMELVDKFLRIYFPLLDSQIEDRMRLADMYDDKAMLTITYRDKLQYSPIYRYFRNLFLRARVVEDGHMESVDGASAIVKLICKWPGVRHDPHTFTVDVMHHGDFSTIIRMNGITKLTVESLAEDEHLVAFTRTVLLMSKTGREYKITNEMLHWDEPTAECAAVAFKNMKTLQNPDPKVFSLKLEEPLDEGVKKYLAKIFMKITDLDETRSKRCLELKEWNVKTALEYYIKLVKLDNLSALTSNISNPVQA